MYAALLDNPKPISASPLRLGEAPKPSPGPGELLVQVNFCGVCRTDLHVVEGELPPIRSPLIPGHQVVGVVVDSEGDGGGFEIGDRVGMAWLHDTCGECGFCRDAAGRENLCRAARFTGYSLDGGYAEFATIPAEFAYRIPDGFSDEQAAPLLCGGIIGFRALRLSAIRPGQRLGLYGFGASAHIAIQVARHWGCHVYVFTRNEANRSLAMKLGAEWAGSAADTPPEKMHASVIFAPAGPLILNALDFLEKGGTVALAGIYMSEVPPMDYGRHLYDEKVLRSVANATRRDGVELLETAAEIPIKTQITVFPLSQANEALYALKTGNISGAAVLRCT